MSRIHALFVRIFLFTGLMFAAQVNSSTITLPYIDSAEDEYALQLFKASLKNQEKPVSLNYYDHSLSGERLYQAFDAGEISVLWLPDSESINPQHHTIKIPIFRGLMSYYQIVSADHRAHSLTSKEQISALQIGMFRDDRNAPELERNGYKVVQARHLQNLQDMLEGGRFDVIFAPVARLHNQTNQYFAVSDKLLTFRSHWFFVVHQNNPGLVRSLTNGLTMLLDSGEMDKLLAKTPWMHQLHRRLLDEDTVALDLSSDSIDSQSVAQQFLLSNNDSALLSATF